MEAEEVFDDYAEEMDEDMPIEEAEEIILNEDDTQE